MRPHIWRKGSGFIVSGYMWIVLNQADILKSTTYFLPPQVFPKT